MALNLAFFYSILLAQCQVCFHYYHAALSVFLKALIVDRLKRYIHSGKSNLEQRCGQVRALIHSCSKTLCLCLGEAWETLLKNEAANSQQSQSINLCKFW